MEEDQGRDADHQPRDDERHAQETQAPPAPTVRETSDRIGTDQAEHHRDRGHYGGNQHRVYERLRSVRIADDRLVPPQAEATEGKADRGSTVKREEHENRDRGEEDTQADGHVDATERRSPTW